jgi:hypothetical protein
MAPLPTHSLRWSIGVLAVAAPLGLLLVSTLWQSPYPVSEAVALFEDVDTRPVSDFFWPTTAYYRPLQYLAMSMVWHGAGSLDSALAMARLLHIGPLLLALVLLVHAMRPAAASDFAAATVAVAVFFGSPGLSDNLELPLSYTIVGMPAALAVWLIAERPRGLRISVALALLLVLAVGFKEQGLVAAAVLLASWWAGAPGVTRRVALGVGASAAAYVMFRLATLPPSVRPFEQDIGLGFTWLDKDDAGARFGAFPWPVYLYNAMSTMGRLLVAEPTNGVFSVTRAAVDGALTPWQLVQVLSSTGLTLVVAWWAATEAVRGTPPSGSPAMRVLAAFAVSVVSCGLLGFNYSRDRLGGMAVPFQALAAYWAVRALMGRARSLRPAARAATIAALVMLAAGWQLRAVSTLEHARSTAAKNHREWLTDLAARRRAFANRGAYLAILEQMVPQGTAPLPFVRRSGLSGWLGDRLDLE